MRNPLNRSITRVVARSIGRGSNQRFYRQLMYQARHDNSPGIMDSPIVNCAVMTAIFIFIMLAS